MAEIHRAKASFAFSDRDGTRRVISRGTLMSDADPAFKGREKLFEPVEVHVEKSDARRAGRTETASADPDQPPRSVPSARRGQSQAQKKAEE